MIETSRWVKLAARHPEEFAQLISRNFPLDESVIDIYADILNFATSGLSANENIPWSQSLIERYAERWDWRDLSANRGLPWTEAFIEHYADQWSWAYLGTNGGLPWSEALIERYADRWNWVTLSTNRDIPWSQSLIERYVERWSWSNLGANTCLPWSETLIEHYKSQWRWEYFGICRNKGLPWTESLIERYKNQWYWPSLSDNPYLPWSEALIERYGDRWQWGDGTALSVGGLSRNPGLPWTESLIEHYSEQWNWSQFGLSINEGIPWTESLIERYENRWHWGSGGLSGNTGLPWSESLIERYADRWDWDSGLSSNEGLPWEPSLIEKYTHRWDWEKLCSNEGIFWFLWIERYDNLWDWEYIDEHEEILEYATKDEVGAFLETRKSSYLRQEAQNQFQAMKWYRGKAVKGYALYHKDFIDAAKVAKVLANELRCGTYLCGNDKGWKVSLAPQSWNDSEAEIGDHIEKVEQYLASNLEFQETAKKKNYWKYLEHDPAMRCQRICSAALSAVSAITDSEERAAYHRYRVEKLYPENGDMGSAELARVRNEWLSKSQAYKESKAHEEKSCEIIKYEIPHLPPMNSVTIKARYPLRDFNVPLEFPVEKKYKSFKKAARKARKRNVGFNVDTTIAPVDGSWEIRYPQEFYEAVNAAANEVHAVENDDDDFSPDYSNKHKYEDADQEWMNEVREEAIIDQSDQARSEIDGWYYSEKG